MPEREIEVLATTRRGDGMGNAGAAGMGWMLTVGWLVLGAYLLVLLALSVVIGTVEAVRGRLQQLAAWTHVNWTQLAHTQEVDHS